MFKLLVVPRIIIHQWLRLPIQSEFFRGGAGEVMTFLVAKGAVVIDSISALLVMRQEVPPTRTWAVMLATMVAVNTTWGVIWAVIAFNNSA